MNLAALDIIARGGHDGPGFFFPLLLLLLLGFLVRGVVRHNRGIGGLSSPMTTLQDRFARGEIGQDEFEHRMAVLKNKKDVPPAPARPAPPAPPAAPAAQQPTDHDDSAPSDDVADEE